MKEHCLRLAILCPGFGVVSRGVETSTEELARHLSRREPGWCIDVFCRGPGGCLSDTVRLVHVPALDRNGRAATLYARLAHRLGIFLRTRIDAECLSFTLAVLPRILGARYDVIFNQAGPFAGVLLKLKRRLDGTPFIHKTASGYSDLELIMAQQRPNAVVATSPLVKDWLKASVQNLTVECIPNAVECSLFRPYSAEELRAMRDGLAVFRLKKPVVLFVGAMDPMKRPELLVHAVAQLSDVSLVMVGTGRIQEEIKRLGTTLLGNRFLHVPYVPRKDLALYYNACDLLTLPSEEPFGIVFLEAMACNKPVLAHHSPIQKWIFGDAGATCDCTNIGEYAAAIETLIKADFGSRPLERSQAFDWTVIGPKYEELLSRIATSRR